MFKASIRASLDLKDVVFVNLGGLRAFKGSQRYSIPAGIDLKDYRSVIIWCERLGVLISPADLTTVVAARRSPASKHEHRAGAIAFRALRKILACYQLMHLAGVACAVLLHRQGGHTQPLRAHGFAHERADCRRMWSAAHGDKVHFPPELGLDQGRTTMSDCSVIEYCGMKAKPSPAAAIARIQSSRSLR